MPPPGPIWTDGPDLPRVSVAVPTYSRPREAAGCVDAILALDYPRDLGAHTVNTLEGSIMATARQTLVVSQVATITGIVVGLLRPSTGDSGPA